MSKPQWLSLFRQKIPKKDQNHNGYSSSITDNGVATAKINRVATNIFILKRKGMPVVIPQICPTLFTWFMIHVHTSFRSQLTFMHSYHWYYSKINKEKLHCKEFL